DEFNNMLSIMRGYGRMLERPLVALTPEHGYLMEMMNAAERATVLAKQLLNLGRPWPKTRKVVNLNAVVMAITPALRCLIGKQIVLAAIETPGLWLTQVDPFQIEQVLINLVYNARDALLANGRIILETANALLTTPL